MALLEIQKRWSEENGYRVVLKMAVPLILSTGAWAIQQFIDRIFLTWYSPEAIAAALPAGISNFTLFSLLIGTTPRCRSRRLSISASCSTAPRRW